MTRHCISLPLRLLFRGTDLAARAGGWIAAALLVCLILHTLLEIVLRSLFDTSTFALDEFVGYGIAAVTFLSAAYAFQEDSFIRVSLLTNRFNPKNVYRRAIEVLCAVLTLVMVSGLTWYFFISVTRHLQRGTVSETITETPLWIPEGLVLVGLALFDLRLASYVVWLALGGPVLEDQSADVDEEAKGTITMREG